jgi:hypothetical protein
MTDTMREFNRFAPCRLASCESDMQGDVCAVAPRAASRALKGPQMELFKQKGDPASQLKAKKSQRDDNASRLKLAEGKLTECLATVERLALEADEGKLDTALANKRAVEDKLAALNAAAIKITKEIGDTEAEIAKAADQRTRAKTAEAIVTLAQQLDEAATAFNTAIRNLEAVLRECAPIVLDAHGCVAFAMGAKNELPPAIAVVLDELRRYRDGVLSGGYQASLPREAPEPKLEIVKPAPPMRCSEGHNEDRPLFAFAGIWTTFHDCG